LQCLSSNKKLATISACLPARPPKSHWPFPLILIVYINHASLNKRILYFSKLTQVFQQGRVINICMAVKAYMTFSKESLTPSRVFIKPYMALKRPYNLLKKGLTPSWPSRNVLQDLYGCKSLYNLLK
jgi:hypothetical protein